MQPTKASEKGITLIALLIMIIIMIILTAVIIRTITGEEPLIGTATDTTRDYKVQSYREEISHVVHSEVIAKSAIGETATTGDIAEALNKQDWIKTAYVNADATPEVGNITAEVNEGYVYQIYYNSIYGKIEIDYIGKDTNPEDLNALMLTARYEKILTKIFAKAEDNKNGIAKVELIYKDQIVGTHEKPTGEVSWDIEKIGTGWYKVKATSNSKAVKYEWIKVENISEKLTPPEIILTSEEPIGGGGWYIAPVTVEMKYNRETAKEIHYRILEEGILKNEDIKYENSFTINNIFRTEIYAWTIDETEKYQSEEILQEIKLDMKAPTVDYEISSIEPPISDWYKGEVTIEIIGEDEGSGIKEYLYSRNGGTTWQTKRMNEEIKITEEGRTDIQIKTKDIAGNESQTKTITIQKDTTPPDKPTIRQTNNSRNSITVEGIGNDNLSGISSYIFEIKPVSGTNSDWTTPTDGTINTETGTQEYTFNNLERGEYSIRVTVTDKAGNRNTSEIILGETLPNTAPEFASTPIGRAVSGTNSQIAVTAKATDEDGDELKYTLWWGTTADNIEATTITTTAQQNTSVTLNMTGLSEYTTYYFKVEVTDQIDSNLSESNSTRTYCQGTYCSGGYYSTTTCSQCSGSGTYGTTTTTCGTCNGSGTNGTTTKTCTTCNGSGTNGTETIMCTRCNGAGKIRTTNSRMRIM